MLEKLINNAIGLFMVETGNEPVKIIVSNEDVFSLPIKKSILGRLVYTYKGCNYKVITKKIESGNFYVQ